MPSELFICSNTGDQKQSSVRSKCLAQVGEKQLPYIQPAHLPTALAEMHGAQAVRTSPVPQAGPHCSTSSQRPGPVSLPGRLGPDCQPGRLQRSSLSALDEHVQELTRQTDRRRLRAAGVATNKMAAAQACAGPSALVPSGGAGQGAGLPPFFTFDLTPPSLRALGLYSQFSGTCLSLVRRANTWPTSSNLTVSHLKIKIINTRTHRG